MTTRRLRNLDSDSDLARCRWCRQPRHDFRTWGDPEECVEIRSAAMRRVALARRWPVTDPVQLALLARVAASFDEEDAQKAEAKAAKKRDQAAARWRAKRKRDRA